MSVEDNAVFAGGYWLLSPRHWFTGPKVQGSAEELKAIEAELAQKSRARS